MTLLDGLDEIDWTALRHAYGQAGDVPDLLRGIVEGPDPAGALDDLDGKIYHQGGSSSPPPAPHFPTWSRWRATPPCRCGPACWS